MAVIYSLELSESLSRLQSRIIHSIILYLVVLFHICRETLTTLYETVDFNCMRTTELTYFNELTPKDFI